MQFFYVVVAAPGGANDIAAFRKTGLYQIIKKLPPRKFVVGDSAYVCSENLLTPFSGIEKNYPAKDPYSFYLSQMRICIAQTFGIMTVKWRILRQPLQMSLRKVGKVFVCITRLHNFCINEGSISVNNCDDSEREIMHSDIGESGIVGNSVL